MKLTTRKDPIKKEFIQFWEQYASAMLLFPVIFLMTYSLGFRAEQWGSDTRAYIKIYTLLLEFPKYFPRYEWLFVACLKWMTHISQTPGIFFSFLIFLNLTLLTVNASLLSQYLWGPNNKYRFILLMYLVCFVSPFFLSAQINVIRQGTALSFIILFYLILLNRYSVFWLLMSAIAAQGFHSTSILFLVPAFGLFLSYKLIIRFLALLIGLYGTSLISYMMQKVSLLTGIAFYDKIMTYGAKANYVKGVRFSFLLFTIGMGFFFDLFGRYVRQGCTKESYFEALKIYWLLSIPFWLVGFGTFSDRFLLPCWTFLSYVLAIILKSIDDAFKPSILLWVFALYVISTGYFIYHCISGA